jgi:putative flippase GtrA
MIAIDRELILYVVFGFFTFVVNFVTYFIFVGLGINYLIANALAWFFSVLFAYITNRKWVFESKSPDILKEMSLFFGGRIFSGVVDTALMYLFIDVLVLGDFISKTVVQIIVIILNYIFSKLIVFTEKNKE